jgi:bacillithiol biosynthesis cysteine-adding enzyme BshC
MKAHYLPYIDTKLFPPLINDYLRGVLNKDLYEFEPSLDGFENKIKQRNNFKIDRELLLEELFKQNEKIKLSKLSQENISKLASDSTFTITTGHQLNLFGGPVYFIYKIASVVKLTQELKIQFPDNDFIPIFWMASEDHDFEEINHFYFSNTKITWDSDQKGGVGRFNLKGIDKVLDEFKSILPDSKNSDYLISLFENSYLRSDNLADATRFLVNELFADYGVVVIDGDSKELKRSFSKIIYKELFERKSFENISKTNQIISDNKYKIQANPREINLFYLKDDLRERIAYDEEGKEFYLVESNYRFSQSELEEILDEFPERFSPNAVFRPVYQEFILPNLAYVGGAGELAYWFELKGNFYDLDVSFPILMLRDSVLILDEVSHRRMLKLDLDFFNLFDNPEDFVDLKAKQNLDGEILDEFKNAEAIFDNLIDKIGVNHALVQSFESLKAKQIKILKASEQKLIRYNKKQLQQYSDSIYNLFDYTLPKGKIQERRMNFSEAYMLFGQGFISNVITKFRPLIKDFTILVKE